MRKSMIKKLIATVATIATVVSTSMCAFAAEPQQVQFVDNRGNGPVLNAAPSKDNANIIFSTACDDDTNYIVSVDKKYEGAAEWTNMSKHQKKENVHSIVFWGLKDSQDVVYYKVTICNEAYMVYENVYRVDYAHKAITYMDNCEDKRLVPMSAMTFDCNGYKLIELGEWLPNLG